MKAKVTVCPLVVLQILIWLPERIPLSTGDIRAGKLQLQAKGRMFSEGQAGGQRSFIQPSTQAVSRPHWL